ncbi:MAG: phage GP46 family protein [Alphaproteobacteria bacterium]
MSDVGIIFDTSTLTGDIQVVDGDLAVDSTLKTAVILSLFSDRRADDTDERPKGSSYRGWWADALGSDKFGSKLWLLARAKHTEETRSRAEDYAKQALEWLIDDEIAALVEVTAEWLSQEILAIEVVITKGDGTVENYQFSNIWEEIINGI